MSDTSQAIGAAQRSSHQELNERIYDRAAKVDRLLNNETVEDHAAILGLIQVTAQRRMHEHQADQQRNQLKAQQEASAKQRFGVQ